MFIEYSIKELQLDGLNAHYFRLGAESIYKYYLMTTRYENKTTKTKHKN